MESILFQICYAVILINNRRYNPLKGQLPQFGWVLPALPQSTINDCDIFYAYPCKSMIEVHLPNLLVDRLPTKEQARLVCSACVFPIHFWAIIVYLYNFPSLILKANLWQVLGVLSYALVFALVESLLLFGFLVLLAFTLPHRVFKARFIFLGTFLALAIPGLALLWNTQFMQETRWVWLPVLGVVGFGLIAALRRQQTVSPGSPLAERFTLIAGLFILLDLLGLLYMLVSWRLI